MAEASEKYKLVDTIIDLDLDWVGLEPRGRRGLYRIGMFNVRLRGSASVRRIPRTDLP
ncbi:hypothetical protein A2U01_0051269, partial [Trifolium medium]|nr:hypothetical protein [Trifolium medium]